MYCSGTFISEHKEIYFQLIEHFQIVSWISCVPRIMQIIMHPDAIFK